MNELQRQKYLSSLGVDAYMPRWHLPYAPISVECDLSNIEVHAFSTQEVSAPSSEQIKLIINYHPTIANNPIAEPTGINNLIGDIFQSKKIEKPSISAITPGSILAQLNAKPETIEPFSLSIWRPL